MALLALLLLFYSLSEGLLEAIVNISPLVCVVSEQTKLLIPPGIKAAKKYNVALADSQNNEVQVSPT